MRLTAVLGISHGRLRRRLGLGPRSRLDLLRNLVTGLVRHERIETTRARADEMRFYAEQVRGGDGEGRGKKRAWGGVPANKEPPPPHYPPGVTFLPRS